ncbi:VOC family protein [Actinoplanes friuliensis]|uniref:VOC family protein n=1 Tax=Actinoplanes friuliensis TaxID=196914 RepID=UPI0005A2DFA8|nr:VOC family protein [Actinoplanes friuliensis]
MLGRNSSHFWGVVLEAREPLELARFYAALMEWEIVKDEPDFVGVAPMGSHVEYLAVQRSAGYERPTWPDEAGHQQMMMHLDIEVPDLERAVTAAVSVGATEAAHQPQKSVRVMIDPAGHPFCLYVDGSS